jgi:hypothetical protein
MNRQRETCEAVTIEALEDRRLMSDGSSNTLMLSENMLGAATADSSGAKQPGVYKSSDGGSTWSNIMWP